MTKVLIALGIPSLVIGGLVTFMIVDLLKMTSITETLTLFCGVGGSAFILIFILINRFGKVGWHQSNFERKGYSEFKGH